MIIKGRGQKAKMLASVLATLGIFIAFFCIFILPGLFRRKRLGYHVPEAEEDDDWLTRFEKEEWERRHHSPEYSWHPSNIYYGLDEIDR